MKRAVVLFAVFVLIISFAGVSYGASAVGRNTGCGVGTMIFEGKDGLFSQVLAATTNAILGNQTFGISSGTLGCEQARSITQNETLKIFVAENMDNLAKDIAMGRGEYLNTLAVLIGVPEAHRAGFYTKLQTNFSRIYTSEKVDNIDVINNIELLISG